MKRMLVFILLLFVCHTMVAQERRFRLVEWNVENLFDTLHDAGFADRDFLPEGSYGWNTPRYLTKASALSRTIAALSGTTAVDLVALCEVENDSVLVQLTQRSLLAPLGYAYVMTHSLDRRGVDVALMYQPMAFRPYAVASLRVPHDSVTERPTRDILFVSGETISGDTLHVFVCHFPSRLGGRRVSEPYRLRAAGVIRQCVDSLFAVQREAKIIVTGDFNDEPRNASIATVLAASVPPARLSDVDVARLYVLSARLKAHDGVAGTYKYRGEWNRLDNILVSGALLTSTEGLRTSEAQCAIAALPHLLERDESRGGVKPRRAFLGTYYHGGVSDHLPLWLDMYY